MNPFLKWPGGKRKYADRILSELPRAETYIEPFLGAGAVALKAMSQGLYQNYLLADADQDLVDTWNAIQTDVSGVLEVVRSLLDARGKDTARWKEHYYLVRSDFNTDKGDGALTAGRMLYLNTYTYNGLYRKNQSGGFNSPYGYPERTRKAPLPTSEGELRAVSELLNQSNVAVVCCDFSQIRVPADAVGFYDPPYWPRQGNGFTQYTAKGFTEQDQIDLAEHFREQEGYCIQTNGPGAAHLYEGLPTTLLNEPTVIGQTGKQRGSAETLLIRNR